MGQVAGTVRAVCDGRAVVDCAAGTSGCALCAGGRGCSWRRMGPRSLYFPAQQPTVLLRAGDAVTLEVSDAGLLLAAARLYLPPLAGLVAGPAVLRAAQWETGEGLSLAVALAGLLVGWLVARRWARQPPPVRLRLVTPAPSPGDGDT